MTASPLLPPDLSWLEGHWRGDDGATATEEHWTGAAGGALVGMHKDVHGDGTVSFEFLRIAPDAEGTVTYFAMPQGRAATEFPLKVHSAGRVAFENLAHDYPQRVLYWRAADGALHARIEGDLRGVPTSVEWRWTRAAPTID